MASLLKLSKIYDNQLWLSIPNDIKQEAWIQSQSQQSNAVAKTNAYYNNIALHTLKPEIESWFEDDYPDGEFPITVFKNSCLPTIWEFLNGTVIEVKGNRIVLITETTETDELCICQEWIDIPSWQGDYFVAVQINPEDDWVRLRGFIEYSLLQRLKDKKGIYDKQERAYYIPNKYLTDIENIGDLVADLQPLTREEFAPIPSPELSPELLQNLGDRYLYYPRLAIDFDKWLKLLLDDKCREELCKKRGCKLPAVAQVTPEPSKPVINIGNNINDVLTWIETTLNKMCDSVEAIFEDNSQRMTPLVGYRIEDSPIGYQGFKEINIASSSVKVTKILGVNKHSKLINIIFDVSSTDANIFIPKGLEIQAFNQDNKVISSLKAEDNYSNLRLKFKRRLGDSFTIKLFLPSGEEIQTFEYT